MPLLYYAKFTYEVRGYESLKVSYGNSYEEKGFEHSLEEAKYIVLEQLKSIDFSLYDDVVFVSKSIGTIIAGWVQQTIL